MTTIARTKAAPSNYHITVLYNRFAQFTNKWQSPLLLLVRIYIGYQCLLSGWTLLHNIDGTTKYFASLRIPCPYASTYVSASAQLVGGAFLLVGFCSRFTALALAFNFFVAMFATQLSTFEFSVKILANHILADQSPLFANIAFPFFAAAVLILFFGPGWLSIDGIFKFLRRKKL
jgi:putative oxidoreductase